MSSPVDERSASLISEWFLSQALRDEKDRVLAASMSGIDSTGGQLLDDWRSELDRRAGISNDLLNVFPSIIILKGPTLAFLYPARWVRSSSDIDICAQADEVFWDVFLALVGDDWELRRITVERARDCLKICARFRERAPPSPMRLSIDLANYDFDDGVIAEIWEGESFWSRQAIAITEELRQRPMCFRDVVDVALVSIVSGLNDFRAYVRSAGLQREWNRIQRQLNAIGLPIAPSEGFGLSDVMQSECAHFVKAARRSIVSIGYRFGERVSSGQRLGALRRTAFARGHTFALNFAGESMSAQRATRLSEEYTQNGDLLLETPIGRFTIGALPKIPV